MLYVIIGNVCELDIIFNFHKAYFILDEFIIGGLLQETSRREILRRTMALDQICEEQMSKAEADRAGFGLVVPDFVG